MTNRYSNLNEQELVAVVKKLYHCPTPAKLEGIYSYLESLDDLADACEDMWRESGNRDVQRFFEVAVRKIDEKRAELEDLYDEKYKQRQKRNVAIGFATVGVLTAALLGGLTLIKNNGPQQIVNKPAIEKPQANNTVLVNKAETIKNIESILKDYKLNQPGNAELVYAYFGNEELTIDNYDNAIEVAASSLINSYRKGDTRMLDVAIAAQGTKEAQAELAAAKPFIEAYIQNPTPTNAVKWSIGAKKAMNDGLTTDYRTLSNTSAHESEMLLFEMAWPVIVENNHNNIRYDEKKIPAELVSNIPLAVDGPVYVDIENVSKNLNKEYEFVVNARSASDKCIKTRTRK